MYWLDSFLLGLAALALLDLLVLYAYCHARKHLGRHNARKQAGAQAVAGQAEQDAASDGLIRRCWKLLEPYLYGWTRYSAIVLGQLPGHILRNLIYRYIFAMNITKHTVIHGGCEICSPWNITADRCVISTGCILDGRDGICIGEDVAFGSGVHIWTQEHSIDDPEFRVLPDSRAPVHIGRHAWICSDVTLLPGVTVGEGAVIAARACLTKDADAFGVYGGIPAKKLRQRNPNLQYQLNRKMVWPFY